MKQKNGCSKKILSLLLSVIMIATALPLTAVSSFAEISGDYTYTVLDDGTAAINRYNGSANNITIPSVLNGYTVTTLAGTVFRTGNRIVSITLPNTVTNIENGVFSKCAYLTSINIPDSVTNIGNSAFSGCKSLESINIPNGVTNIGDSAFSRCTSLESINISDSVTNIGDSAFSGCTSLESINIPNGVTNISNSAFSGCTLLKYIIIGNSVNNIGLRAFYKCTSLESINVNSGNKQYASVDGILYNKQMTTLITYPTGKKNKNLDIINSVTNIGDSAFSGCISLESINIPDSVTSIGESAFSGCTSLASIRIPDSVTNIGISAFFGCISLESINIPDSVTSIGESAFSGCTSLASIRIPDSVTNIGDSAFSRCTSLESINIPDSVTKIGRYAFNNCSSLSNITLSDSLTYIPVSVFDGTAFYNESTNWKNDILYIGKYLIAARPDLYGKRSITSGTRVIAERAFYSCTSLTSITIPDSVKNIGDGAFWGCTSLESINIPDSVISIGSGAFHSCTSLESITIPDTIEIINDYTFYCCSALRNVTIPNSVKSIEYVAFGSCTALESVTIGSGVKSIGKMAFSSCNSLQDVYYVGNPSSWNNIDISIDGFAPDIDTPMWYGNNYLLDANRHYCRVVSYDYLTNGGYFCTDDKILTEIGKEVDLTPVANKNNSTFIGWNTDPNSTVCLKSLTMPENDIILYAVFRNDQINTYTVSYNANGGTNAPASQTKTENESLTLSSAKPSKSYVITYNANGGSVSSSSKSVNCTFKNWNTKSDGSGTSYNSGAIYTANANAVLYAQYTNPSAGTLPTPTRSGYTFMGWFTSADGGNEIKSSSVITASVTLYAHWSKNDVLSRSEQFSFANSRSAFTHDNYYITDEDFKKLTDYVNTYYSDNPGKAKTVINNLQYFRNSNWGGSCYGMAVSTLLDKSNQIGFNENFDPSAQTMSAVSSPKNNSDVESAINYYFLSQFVHDIVDSNAKCYYSWNSNWKAGLKQLVSMVKEGKPMLFCYYFSGGGHAIVAKGYRELSDGSFEIITYDNRYPDHDITVSIDAAYTSCVVNADYGKENAYAIEYTQDMSAFDLIDIDGKNNIYNANNRTNNTILRSANNDSSSYAQISVVPKGKIIIENAEGEQLVVENGIASGDMETALRSFNVSGTAEDNNEVTIVLDVRDSDYFIFESDNENLNVGVVSKDIYAQSVTNGANYVVISKKDGISVLGNKFDYKLSLSINNELCDMLSIEGNANNDVRLEKKKTGIKASGVDDKSGKVTVFSNVVDVDNYIYEQGYSSFEVVSDGTDEPGNIQILGSSNDNGIYDVNIGTAVDENGYQGFPDVHESDWFYDSVKYCATHGFITGYKSGKFGPADALQRQDFVVILARIAGANLDSYTSCKLKDVDMSAYYGKAVAWAVDKGIITGYDNGKFGVGDKITREQVATILYRYMCKPTVSNVDDTLAKFTDKGSVSAFSKDAIAWANQNGIINGKTSTTLAPTATASRAEIATIVMRMDKQGMFA